MKSLRVGIIGCGNMGRRHARAYQYHAPRTQLVAMCDLRREAAEQLSREFGGEVESSVESLLARQDIDAVSICTIETAHVEPTVQAARAKKHILIEKPMAMTMPDALAMRRSVEQAGIKFMVGHLYRFDHRCIEAKKLIDAGRLGRLVSVEVQLDGTPSQQDRIKDVELSIVTFRGCHGLDLLRWLIGREPERVYCESIEGHLRGLGYHSEDAAYCLLRFPDNVIGSIGISAHIPRTHPTAGRLNLAIAGTKGLLQCDLSQPWFTLADDASFVASQGSQKDLWFREEIDAFANVVLDDAPNIATADDAIAALRISLAAVESARLNRPVDLSREEARS